MTRGSGASPTGTGLLPSVEPASGLAGSAASIPSAKHTPGPWLIERKNPYETFVRGAPNDQGFHYAVAIVHPGHDNATEANARLIASAPALLEALEAQAEASAFAAEASEITPDGETIAKHIMDRADTLFARAERLRDAAINLARGAQ